MRHACVSVPGALKPDHLQSVKPILFPKFSNLISGLPFLITFQKLQGSPLSTLPSSSDIYCIPLTPITSYFHTQRCCCLTYDTTQLRLVPHRHRRLLLRGDAAMLPLAHAADRRPAGVPERGERVPVRRRAERRVGGLGLWVDRKDKF